MENVTIKPLPNGLLRVYSYYTLSVVGLAQTWEEAKKLRDSHLSRMGAK